ncbi:MAG TPA: hypothetical protein VF796_03515 [Humisphaera sp.]
MDTATSTARPAEPTAPPPPGSPPLAGLPAVGEFTRLALWMAGTIAGLSTPTHAAQGRRFRAMARRLGWSVCGRRGRVPTGDAALAVLAEALVGSSRWAVSGVFGPPRFSVADDPVSDADAVWSGRAWYYAMRRPGVSAVAVEFADDLVRRVVFVRLDGAGAAAA